MLIVVSFIICQVGHAGDHAYCWLQILDVSSQVNCHSSPGSLDIRFWCVLLLVSHSLCCPLTTRFSNLTASHNTPKEIGLSFPFELAHSLLSLNFCENFILLSCFLPVQYVRWNVLQNLVSCISSVCLICLFQVFFLWGGGERRMLLFDIAVSNQ